MKVVELNNSRKVSVGMRSVRFNLGGYLILFGKISTLLVVTLLMILKYTTTTNVVAAIGLVFVSFLWVLKTFNNLPAFLMASFILYVNYSVAVGEFLTTVPTSCPLAEVNDAVTYGTSIRLILIFITIVALFYKPRSYNVSADSLSIRNDFIFLAMIVALGYLFFQTRQIDRAVYTVAIEPEFEYSRLIFLAAGFMVGRKNWRKLLIIAMACLYVLKDAYYGGRATSVQIIFALMLTLLVTRLSVAKILLLSFLGLLGGAYVGAYRSNFFIRVSPWDVTSLVLSSFFVSDTATYSFYASATHVATVQVVSSGMRINSFLQFLGSTFLGSRFFNLADVTKLSNQYYRNVGGGILPTHFYFWGSWALVVGSAIMFVLFLNRVRYNTSRFARYMFLAVVVATPRWYLYGPISLIRGGILLPAILYALIWALDSLSKASRGKEGSRMNSNSAVSFLHNNVM